MKWQNAKSVERFMRIRQSEFYLQKLRDVQIFPEDSYKKNHLTIHVFFNFFKFCFNLTNIFKCIKSLIKDAIGNKY